MRGLRPFCRLCSSTALLGDLPAAAASDALLWAATVLDDPCFSGRAPNVGGGGGGGSSSWSAGRRRIHHGRWHDQQQQQQEASSATELAGLAVTLTEGDPFLEASRRVRAGPLRAYRKGGEEGLLRKDGRQEATALALQRLYDDLAVAYPPATPSHSSGLTMLEAASPPEASAASRPWWKGLFLGGKEEDRGSAAARHVQGLYMHGGVGVGKTMLMDLLAATAPPDFRLERTHFHDFMLGVHAALRRHQHTADPLTLVANDLAARLHVLCLDEVFVTDVADAMILHRLFARLWDQGLTLVATSNRRPDALYEGGLQRSLFLPFIARLKAECAVHDMSSTTDYRRLAHHRAGLYYVTPTRDEDLYCRFVELTNGAPVGRQYAEVAMGRQLEMPRVGGCIAYFTFDELCNRPLGAADYIALADAKHTLAVGGVPTFTPANRAAAYRFVTLVDVLYEHKIRLLCSAEAMPQELFENVVTNREAQQLAAQEASGSGRSTKNLVVDDNLGFAKDRTVSRLTEMQSSEYLRMHANEHAPELLYALTEAERADRREAAAAQ